MRRHRAAAVLAALAAAAPSAARVAVVEPSDGRWTARDQPVVLRFEDRPPPSEGRLAIFIGRNDVTGTCAEQSSGDLRCSAAMLPLPQGEQEIAVYLVKGPTEWQEIARLPIRVLTRAGLEVAELAPRLDLDQSAELDRGGSADAAPAPGNDWDGWAGHGGIATRWRREGWELRSAWNVMGATARSKALRYPILGEEAPEVDLSDYLVELQRGKAQLALGHVSHGDQPLLLSGLSHRGLRYAQRLADRLDVGFTAQSGQILTGYSDLPGVDGDNYIAGASAGLEFLRSRPGGLRMNLMVLDAQTRSDADFNTGQVPDAEEQSGYGVRLVGATPGNRLRGGAEFARSRYTNPDDPVLAQGLDLVPVRGESSAARSLDLALDLLQNRRLGAATQATVTLGFQHLHSDPLYRTVGALVAGDQASSTGTLNAVIGGFSFQALHADSEDNVDDLRTVLKTSTRTTMVSFSLPLRSLFRSPDGSSPAWLPDSVSESYSRIHQVGMNRPPSFDPATHIPDQVTESFGTGLDWSFGRATLGYQFALGVLDNRQPARAHSDFQDVTHSVNAGLQVTSALRVGLGANATSADDREQSVERRVDSYALDLDWRLERGFGLRGSYTRTQADDTRELSASRGWTALAELDYRFGFPASRSRRLPAQFYVRHVSGEHDLSDRVFGLSSHSRSWSINGGFSVGLF